MAHGQTHLWLAEDEASLLNAPTVMLLLVNRSLLCYVAMGTDLLFFFLFFDQSGKSECITRMTVMNWSV